MENKPALKRMADRVGRSAHLIPWLVLCAGLVLTYHAWTQANASVMNVLKVRFDHENMEILSKIRQRMVAQEQVLLSARGLFSASGSVERQEFRAFVEALGLVNNYPGIQGVGYSTVVQPRDRQRHIAMIRREGFPQYDIRPEGAREIYSSIIYLEPFNWRNQRAFGYDMISEPVQRKAMERARDAGGTALSGRVRLVQETHEKVQSGTLLYLPVYRNDAKADTVEARREHIRGWVYLPLRMYDLMEGTLDRFNSDLMIDLYDGDRDQEANLMYSTYPEGRRQVASVPLFEHRQLVEYFGQKWLLVVRALPAFDKDGDFDDARTQGYMGVLITVLFAALTWGLVHGRERAMKVAQDMTQELRSLSVAIEQSPTSVVITDTEANIIYVNPRFSEVTGYALDEVVGKNPRILQSGQTPAEIYRDLWEALSAGGVWHGELINKTKGGEIFREEAYISPVRNASGGVTNYVSVKFDITERRKAEIELLHAHEELERRVDQRTHELAEANAMLQSDIVARRKIEEVLRSLNETLELRVAEEVAKNREKDALMIQQSRLAAMGEMIGNIAHQWRQPLNALALVLSNIRDAHQFNELDERFLDKAVGDGNRLISKMSGTINDFRDFFRPDKGKVVFSGLEQINQAIALVDASFKNSNIMIHVDAPEDVAMTGFPGEYSQVLLNLLANAKEAIIAHGGGRQGRVDVVLRARDGKAVVTVSDNGGGIPAGLMEKIFEPYFSTKQMGSGIGLYMSKMIIERNMNGAIDVANTGDGALFTVITPLKETP